MTAPDRPVRYELKSVKALRGTEGRSIAKWQNEGWELVDQNASTLYTTLNFRKVKADVPWKLLAVLGGIVAFLLLISSIASALDGGDEKQSNVAKPAPAATSEPSEKPSEKPSPKPSPSPSTKAAAKPSPKIKLPAVLTLANSPDLAALLALEEPCNAGPFATKYSGRTISFDGSIAAMANHGSYDTRYDILVSPGDRGPNSVIGPNFQFRDVGVADLRLTGNVPDGIGPGDLLRVTATVGKFNPDACLLYLRPVSTQVR